MLWIGCVVIQTSQIVAGLHTDPERERGYRQHTLMRRTSRRASSESREDYAILLPDRTVVDVWNCVDVSILD